MLLGLFSFIIYAQPLLLMSLYLIWLFIVAGKMGQKSLHCINLLRADSLLILECTLWHSPKRKKNNLKVQILESCWGIFGLELSMGGVNSAIKSPHMECIKGKRKRKKKRREFIEFGSWNSNALSDLEIVWAAVCQNIHFIVTGLVLWIIITGCK